MSCERNSGSDGGDGGGDDGAVQCSSASFSAPSSSAPVSPTSYQCPAAGCVKQYDKFTSMKSHVFYKHANDAVLRQQVTLLFENAPRLLCEACEKTFKNSESLLKHRREVHRVEVSSSSVCFSVLTESIVSDQRGPFVSHLMFVIWCSITTRAGTMVWPQLPRPYTCSKCPVCLHWCVL